MRTSPHIAILSLASLLPAQSFYVPTNSPGTGTNNAFPFNTSDMRYQALVTAANLGNTPVVIHGFGLAAVTTGTRSFTRVTMKMAHIAAPTLSTTFDANLAAGAVTVMNVPNWKWNLTGGLWNDVDLQLPFIYNGVDNLVVEFQVYGGAGSAGGMFRDGTNQRVYLSGYTGQLTGTDGGLSAFKMRLITGDATAWTFGAGCVGSNSLTPTLTLTGTSKLGMTLNVDLKNALNFTPIALHLGTTSAAPLFPFDLGTIGAIGAPGCLIYHDVLIAIPMASTATGTAIVPLAVPNYPGGVGTKLYVQYVGLDIAANTLGVTTSNYGRVLIGN